ncbi:MAG: ATP-dependent helicase [Deltaproteobacteria bacterium]|nr:ATP-dependent helicase [Deltaproteobacteria bacterium]
MNPEQERAVRHDQGPLLIIAGAGTGKTRVITHRIAYLIATKRARPEEILALTFTDKAAAEMEQRVDVLVPYGYANVWISTFHAFGDRVLREHALELGLDPSFRVLTRPEQLIFAREHLFELPLKYYRPLGDPTKHVDALMTLFSRAKDEDVSQEEHRAYARALAEKAAQEPEDAELQEEAARQRELAETYAAYRALMGRSGFVDFGDQVVLPLKLFREHPLVRQRFQNRFKYILVDEFQDTNYAQFQVVKLLAERHRNLAVVADDDQSIYKFRGAAVSNILGFIGSYPDAERVVLTENYRSTQAILDAAYRLITHNNPDRLEVKEHLQKRLQALQPEGPAVRHLHYDTVSSEADGVADRIAAQVASGVWRYQDVAILVRSNNDADPFLRSLNMRAIPWRFTGTRGLYDREEVRLLLAFLRAVADFHDGPSLYYLASSELYQLDPVALTWCMNYASRKNLSLHEVFLDLEQIPELHRVPPEARATIAKLLDDLQRYVRLARQAATGEVLYQFLTDMGYLQRLSRAGTLAADQQIRNIAKFFEIIRHYRYLAVHDRVPEFVRHLDMLISAGDDPAVAEADLDADAVNVLTVHKAKGLEFPVVFLVGLVQGRFPWPHRHEAIELPEALIKDVLPAGDFHLQEERRLFYVGMTRARRELYLTSARDYGGNRPRKVSQFVAEALDLPKAEPAAFKASALEVIARHAPPASSGADGPGAIPDDEPLTLSYFQLDDYLTCPLKYKFVHILRVPILQHHAVVYGRALHQAVQEYHVRRTSGRYMSEEELLQVFEGAWINEGFLSPEHEAQRKEAGRAALRRFYQAQEADGRAPTFVEKEFSFPLGHDRVIGRWDRVDVSDEEVVVIDFKSSEIFKQKEADQRAKESLQLAIYALAYKEVHGRLPDRVELHFLESGLVGRARKTEADLQRTVLKIKEAARGIRARDFTARPSYLACRYCAYNRICPYTASEVG